jgi:multiple sugar transport system substrate-binding protein
MNNGTRGAAREPIRLPNFDDDASPTVCSSMRTRPASTVAPKAADVQSISTMDLFSSGKAAMALGGHWRYQTFARRRTRHHRCCLWGRTATVPAQHRHHRTGHRSHQSPQATGVEFVKFATGAEGRHRSARRPLRSRADIRDPSPIAHAHSRIHYLGVLTDGPAHSGNLPVTRRAIDALMDRDFGPVLGNGRQRH